VTVTPSRPLGRLSLLGTDRSADSDAPVASFVGEAACASARALGIPPSTWTPEVEAESVPVTLMRICETCPVWAVCLREAVRLNDVGYRASTTTSQRRRMFPEFAVDPTIDRSPCLTLDVDGDRRPRHPRGEGSLSRYRRGCQCDECRGHNAAARRKERARAS